MYRYVTLLAYLFVIQSPIAAHTTHHIFIHGTSLIEPSLLIKSQSLLAKIGIRPETVINFLTQERAKSKYQEREILLEPGLIEIDPSIIEDYLNGRRSYAQDKKAAYPTIAYFSQLVDTEPASTHHFYTFGWSGTLLEKARIEASNQLAHALCILAAHHKKEPLTISLYAHSHGGTVALHLAKEELIKKHRITIDNLVMFGTPLQPETAQLALDEPFNNVFNLLSAGDMIQQLDIFSGSSWRPGQRLGDYIDLKEHNKSRKGSLVCDIQLLLNQNPKAVGHHNMWLYNKIGSKLPCLRPLPLVALTPCILHIAKKLGVAAFMLNISGSVNAITLHDQDKKVTIKAFIKAPQ